MKHTRGLLTLGLLAALLPGCSRQGADPLGEGLPANPQPSFAALSTQLPPLPDGREASVVVGMRQYGNQATLRAPGAADEGTSLRLPSAPGAICWGVWGFTQWPNAVDCTVTFSGNAGAEAYFALADYSKGAWEISGPLAGPQQVITIDAPKYASSSGDVFIAVISFDGAGILVDQLVMVADPAPVQTPIDNSGGFTSMAMVNASPAIAYYDDSSHDLRYVRATNRFGAAWGPARTVDSIGDTGQWTSLKVVDGFPAIAYYDFTEKHLRYVRALDEDGASWGAPITVDTAANNGEYCSLDIVAGQPAISYYYYDGPSLRYVRALDPAGATWDLPVDVDSDGNTGQYSSLEMVYSTFESYPAISYRNGGAGELRYVRATDGVGATWDPTPVILDSGSNSGFSSSMALVNGVPAICYYDSSESALRYVQATDLLGDAWGAPQTVDGLLEDAGDYCSLAVIGGFPAISYYNGLHGDLRFIQALDSNGATWGSSVLLDESSNVIGQDTFLLEVYGLAGISYYDQTNGKLRYTWGN